MNFFALIYYAKEIKIEREERKILSQENIDLDGLSGEQFEHFLYILFLELGYEVLKTAQTGDFGADLIIMKDQHKTSIQAKRYSSKVGVHAVQEVLASKKYYKANGTAVITTNFFTDNAKRLATANNVMLIDRNGLVKLIAERNKERDKEREKYISTIEEGKEKKGLFKRLFNRR